MKVHELKTIQPHFDMVADGRKKFELRKNDRDFHWNDILILREWSPLVEGYMGNEVVVRVTNVLQNFQGIEPGYCILSISEPI